MSFLKTIKYFKVIKVKGGLTPQGNPLLGQNVGNEHNMLKNKTFKSILQTCSPCRKSHEKKN
jgi:hypothetical protein